MYAMMSSYEPPPILLGAAEEEDREDVVDIPEECLEEVVAAAVADAATTAPQHDDKSKKKKKQNGTSKKSTSSATGAASTKKRKRRQQSSKKYDDPSRQSNVSSSPTQKKRKSRTVKLCSVIGCTNQSQNGKVCIRHGAQWSKKQCSVDDCTKQAINGGVCRKHGAKIKECTQEGCKKHAKLRGACLKHSNIRLCSHNDGSRNGGKCLNEAKLWGLCARHGGLVGLCYSKGCINKTFWGLCQLHGGPEDDFCCFDGCSNCLVDDAEESDSDTDEEDRVRLCLHKGCIDLAETGGVCDRHSDEAYLLYPLCQPCDKNKVYGEDASDKDVMKLPAKQTLPNIKNGRGDVIANDDVNSAREEEDKTSASVTARQDADHKQILEVVDRNCVGKDGKHCILDGCFRYCMEEGGLYCKRHRDTNTLKICKQDGCSVIVSRIGIYCRQHVIMPLLKEASSKKPPRATITCNHVGCSNKVSRSSNGFCSSHKPKIIHKRCSHEGCSRFAKAKGVCITHGATIQRKLCSIDGCQNQAKRRRVCKKHGAYDDSIFVG